MNFKDSTVNFDVSCMICLAAKQVDEIYKSRLNHGVTITSARDGRHSRTSKHYVGEAIDIRVWGMTETQRVEIAKEIASKLGPEYDVVDEVDHIHIEYDPKVRRS